MANGASVAPSAKIVSHSAESSNPRDFLRASADSAYLRTGANGCRRGWLPFAERFLQIRHQLLGHAGDLLPSPFQLFLRHSRTNFVHVE